MKKTKEEKVVAKKQKYEKPFVCRSCRAQFNHDVVSPGNAAGSCPLCGGPIRSKEFDRADTHGSVKRTRLAKSLG